MDCLPRLLPAGNSRVEELFPLAVERGARPDSVVRCPLVWALEGFVDVCGEVAGVTAVTTSTTASPVVTVLLL